MASPESGDPTSGATTTITNLHPDILTHILRYLDGATLATLSSTTPHLRSLCNQDHLWQSLCHVTFPAIPTNPPLHHLISTFPGGFRSFYADSFPLLPATLPPLDPPPPPLHRRPSDLITVVEIYHNQAPIFSKTLFGIPETTDHDWLCNSPFRLDLLDHRDKSPEFFSGEKSGRRSLSNNLRLSWVSIDRHLGRAVNLSSWAPVSVQKEWLTEMGFAVRFSTVVRISGQGDVEFGIVVRCGGCGEEGEVRVSEVSLQVGDMDGRNLNGDESLGILQRAMGCEKRGKGCEEEVRRRYDAFVKLQAERKQKKINRERRVDMACVVSGIFVFFAFWALVVFR